MAYKFLDTKEDIEHKEFMNMKDDDKINGFDIKVE
jgi:hypothetical protein